MIANGEYAWWIDDDGSPPDCNTTEGSGTGAPAPQGAYFAAALARRIAQRREATTFVPESTPATPPAQEDGTDGPAADAAGMQDGPTDGDATPADDAAEQSALPMAALVPAASPPSPRSQAAQQPLPAPAQESSANNPLAGHSKVEKCIVVTLAACMLANDARRWLASKLW